MKKTIIILLYLLSGILLKAQETMPAEYTRILCDRAFYVSGEEIQFSGLVLVNNSNEIFSEVVYIELIDPLGNRINQQKIYLDKNKFVGRMRIPETSISGFYFLTAYTKWMRNGSSSCFDKLMIKVVNPFLFDVQQYSDSLYMDEKPKSPVYVISDSLLSKEYCVGENIEIDLFKPKLQQSVLTQISVIPKGSDNYLKPQEKCHVNHYSEVTFYPETRGLSLSGKIFQNEKVSPNHLAYLNIMGEKDFYSIYTNDKGEFYFALPKITGINELMIGAIQKQGTSTELVIDNDFYNGFMVSKTLKFELNKEEEALALQLTKQLQINNWYCDSISNSTKKNSSTAFYEKAFKTIDFDFYVPLDSMPQYFTDISSYVQVKKRKGKRYFQLIGDDTDLSIFDPLLLVNWIPIYDAERILNMDAVFVKEIDIINRTLFHGNNLYGGLIHIKTRDGKKANLKLPESSVYLNFLFPEDIWEDNVELQFPGTPYYKVMGNNLQKTSFQCPALSGEYVIVIQQIKSSGEKTSYHMPFKVID